MKIKPDNFLLIGIIILFLLILILLVPLTSFSSTPLLEGSFVEYKVYYHNYQAKVLVVSLEIENVTQIFSNSTFLYKVWYINLNGSYYYPPGLNLDNLSYPKTFFYIPVVGKSIINRSVALTLIGEYNNTYIYTGVQTLTYGNYINWTVYVNSSGVPWKIFLYQYIGNDLVSNTTYVLFKSNLANRNESIYFPSDVTLLTGKQAPLLVGNVIFSTTFGKVEEGIIAIGAIALIIILLFRKTSSVETR